MKRLYLYMCIALLLAASYSCTEEAETAVSVGGSLTVTGTFARSASRTAYEHGDGYVDCSWVEGDVIGIMSSGQQSPQRYRAASSGSMTEFEALGEGVEYNDGEEFCAWYPYTSGAGNAHPYAILPTLYVQGYNDGNLPPGKDFIYAQGTVEDNTLSLSFQHLYAFLEITISTDLLDGSTGFVLKSTEAIAYKDGDGEKAYYDFESGAVVNTTEYNYIWYQIDSTDLENSEYLKCYVAMMPTSGGSTLGIYKMTTESYTQYSMMYMGDVIDVKSVPEDGFQAGHVYSTTISGDDEEYESEDYTDDGMVFTLQEHTAGDGIKLVILGDAYSDRLIEDGTYEKHVGWAYDAYFSEEPFASFKDYFDVYYVNVVSANETIGKETAFGVSYNSSTSKLTFDESVVEAYLENLDITGNSYKDVNTIVIVNTPLSLRSITYIKMYWNSRMVSYASTAYCACCFEDDFRQVVQHEACGHGLGKLADEYVEYSDTFTLEAELKDYHSYNWYLNVDTESDPAAVLWSYFISDEGYADENIGVYEGAYLYPYGVYRSTENSIMRDNTGGFNAPSRQSIYRNIMEYSGGTYSFEEFLEYDEVNRQRFGVSAGAKGRTEARPSAPMGAPPVIFIE